MVCHLNRRVQLFVRTQLIVTGGVVGINRKRVSDFMESPKLFVPPTLIPMMIRATQFQPYP
jgi:hypothetical protein